MVEETYDNVGSPITVGLKDCILIRAAAEHVAVPMPSLNVYRDRLLGAVAHGDGWARSGRSGPRTGACRRTCRARSLA
jgi:hypothetical protein